MDREKLLAIFKLTEMATNLGNTFANIKNTNDAFAINKQKQDYANELRNETALKTLNLQSQKEANAKKLKEMNVKLKESEEDLERSGIIYENLPTLGLQFQTDEFKDLLDENEATLTKDFVFTSQTADTFAEQQERFQFEIDTKEKLLNELNPILNSLQQNEDHLRNIGTQEGKVGIRDYADIRAFVDLPENESTFKVPNYLTDETGQILVHPEGHESAGLPIIQRRGDGSLDYTTKDNYLVKDLLQEERTVGGIDYGHGPRYTKTELSRASLATSKQAEIKYGFDDINQWINNMVSTGMLTSEDIAEWGLTAFKGLKGDKYTYQDTNNLLQLKKTISNSFIEVLNSRKAGNMPFEDEFLGIGESEEAKDMWMIKVIKNWIMGEPAQEADGTYIKGEDGQYNYSQPDGEKTNLFTKFYETSGPIYKEGWIKDDIPGNTHQDVLIHKLLTMYLNVDKSLEIFGVPSLGREMYLNPEYAWPE